MGALLFKQLLLTCCKFQIPEYELLPNELFDMYLKCS